MAIATSSLHKLQLPALADRLERLRVTGRVSHQEWFDLLGVPWLEYLHFRSGQRALPDSALDKVAARFSLPIHHLVTGQIDFSQIETRLAGDLRLPEIYTKAAHGRRRTSITSVEYLEKRHGWRLRLDAVRKLGVNEGVLRDPFAPISMKFITDLCEGLRRRQFGHEDFVAMGAYGYDGNKNTVVGRMFSQMRSPAELYEFFFGESLKLFEQNCSYTITRMDQDGLTLEVLSDPHVAAEAGVRHLGSASVCSLKVGFIGALTRYLGLGTAEMHETCCVHKGDEVCRFELKFPRPVV